MWLLLCNYLWLYGIWIWFCWDFKDQLLNLSGISSLPLWLTKLNSMSPSPLQGVFLNWQLSPVENLFWSLVIKNKVVLSLEPLSFLRWFRPLTSTRTLFFHQSPSVSFNCLDVDQAVHVDIVGTASIRYSNSSFVIPDGLHKEEPASHLFFSCFPTDHNTSLWT